MKKIGNGLKLKCISFGELIRKTKYLENIEAKMSENREKGEMFETTQFILLSNGWPKSFIHF